ncbi:MAG: hypothetical protein HOP29_06130 [Phycisphaerales bacterium]|nr:hypothetical protein [Phycisphaerales bacterium]
MTAEYNAALFDVSIHGRIRSGSAFNCASAPLAPYAPRLIVGSEVSTTNVLRYPELLASTSGNPAYVKVRIKPGRSLRDAGGQTVTLRVHSYNWGGSTTSPSMCATFGDCSEGFRFHQRGATTVQVFHLESPPNWCQEAGPLDPQDALPISSLPDGQRQAAEFDGAGAKAINDLTAELPNLRVGHCRFRSGRTIDESLGNDAYWHSGFGSNQFVRMDAFGVWCAVDDLPGWTWQQAERRACTDLSVMPV